MVSFKEKSVRYSMCDLCVSAIKYVKYEVQLFIINAEKNSSTCFVAVVCFYPVIFVFACSHVYLYQVWQKK